MNKIYENFLYSQALRSFFSLNEKNEVPKELYLILDRIKTRQFKPGEKIIQKGDKADSLFIIEKGQADVISESSGGIVIGQLNSGDFFGEVALLTGKTRTATIIARTNMTVYELFKDDLDQVTKTHPHIIGTLLQKLYDRLKVSYLSLEPGLTALTFGLFALLLAPLSTYCFFNDLRFWKYFRYFFPMAITCWRLAFLWLSSDAYRNEFSISLTAPPMSSPDLNIVKIKDTWNAGIFDCNQCGKCCQILKCPLQDSRNLCRAYNSFFWRYFSCGRYPINKQQIEFYDCPKWEMRI